MADEQNLETIMGLIINGGNAKSSAMEQFRPLRRVTLTKLLLNYKNQTLHYQKHTMSKQGC